MIKVVGNEVIVKRQHPKYSTLRMLLTKYEDEIPQFLYKMNSHTGSIKFPKGLVPLLPDIGLTDKDIQGPTNISDQIDFINSISDDILPGVKLRSDQVLTIFRALIARRGLIQAATGSGKTYMICGFLVSLYKQLGYYPNTIILVPTLYLVEQMIKVMRSFNIPAIEYSNTRKEVRGVIVTHPQSIVNDLKSGMTLEDVDVLIGDEAHHAQAVTWSELFIKSVNANYILGFSASIIESKRLPITKITQLSYSEAKTIGCTGNILIDLPTSYYRDKGILATSKIIRIEHKASEPVTNERNWHQLRKCRLESDNRTRKMAQIAKIYHDRGLKTLILINTHDHGYRLLDMLDELGLSKVSMCSYGSSKFYQNIKGKRVNLPPDTMDKFNSGEFTIMVGSSHIYEGVDIQNLDAVILGVVGKSDRRIIQAVGRSLRKTKNGKYSYIIDFMDTSGGVLAYHSYRRYLIFKEQIGASPEDIFNKVPLSSLDTLLRNLEEIGGGES